MREMQDGTISDVKETRTMLKELQEQTLELIELQKGNKFESKIPRAEIHGPKLVGLGPSGDPWIPGPSSYT